MTDAATAADLMFRPASELADLVRDGQITARELVEASLSRIDALNPVYNAFIDVFHDEALLAADAVICHNDIVAHGAASIAMELGRQPGKDVFFSGEGFYRELQYWYPAITTSSVDYSVLTAKICDLVELRGSGNQENPQKIEIPTELINP